MRSDARGIMSLPFKLAIMMAVIAFMAPIVAGVVDQAEDLMDSMGPSKEASKLRDAAADAYRHGAGTVVTVDLSIRPDESLIVGGDGADAYVIRVVSGGDIKEKVPMERPVFPFLGGTTVISESGPLKLKCVFEDGVLGIKVML